MWEPGRLTALWVSTACYRNNFTFLFLPLSKIGMQWQTVINLSSIKFHGTSFSGFRVISRIQTGRQCRRTERLKRCSAGLRKHTTRIRQHVYRCQFRSLVVTPCRCGRSCQLFGGSCCFHFHGRCVQADDFPWTDSHSYLPFLRLLFKTNCYTIHTEAHKPTYFDP
jgi:hypothetical protein